MNRNINSVFQYCKLFVKLELLFVKVGGNRFVQPLVLLCEAVATAFLSITTGGIKREQSSCTFDHNNSSCSARRSGVIIPNKVM